MPGVQASFNDAPDDEQLRADLTACCAARDWVAALVAGWPFADQDELFEASDAATAALSDAGLAEALAGHPRIGDRPHGEWSRQEQSGMSAADASVRAELAAANLAYEQRFGHIYLVCASGRSAEELLAVCLGRLANDPATERGVVLGELAKINRIRLAKLLRAEGDSE
jgi:2-oxo-4-hydroxy-4-carboxy-5-ureidoimidazoline decarboxylase